MRLLGKIVRWLLVPVSAVMMVGLAVLGGRGAVAIIDSRCPPASMVGGACVAPWHTTAVEWVIYGATVFGVLALVIVPALVAPRLERTVAGAGALLAIGSTAALYVITAWSVMVPLVVIAAAAAALGLASIWRRRTAHAET